jgi:NAD(P)-dependent dehydrogenase (short-subunit alcohol dehydrogenase family)
VGNPSSPTICIIGGEHPHSSQEGNITAGTFAGGAGAVLAGKTPLGQFGRVTDIAPPAVFLASDESAWITGEVIRAAGGLVVAA